MRPVRDLQWVGVGGGGGGGHLASALLAQGILQRDAAGNGEYSTAPRISSKNLAPSGTGDDFSPVITSSSSLKLT